MNKYRLGFGFDVHRITRQRKNLMLGGARVPSPFALRAVSDGDVALHAVSDALCGAAGLGDIGDYFPPSLPESKGINSRDILYFVLKKAAKRHRIINIDTIIVADKPPLVSYKAKILKSLKLLLKCSSVNIKIKSKENLNILGGRNSISCFAVALLKRR